MKPLLLIDVLNSKPVLEGLLDQKMSGKLAYALTKNIRRIDPELDAIDRARDKILASRWPLNFETQTYEVPDEDKETWRQLYTELLEQPSDVKPYLMPTEWFEDVKISPRELMLIDWLLIPEPMPADEPAEESETPSPDEEDQSEH